MAKQPQSQDVQKAVLKSAVKLLQSKGYEGTRIQDISRLSGVSSGSIYHFFGSKDGVLAKLIEEMFERAASAADRADRDQADPYLALSLELAGQVELISRSASLASIYGAAYRSWTLTQVIVSAGVKRNRALFAKQLPDWGEDQFFAATSVIKGILSALVDERVHLDRLTLKQRVEWLLRSVLPVFGATDRRAQDTISAVLKRLASGSLAPAVSPE